MEDGHFIDDPLAVVGVKPDFSDIGMKKRSEFSKPLTALCRRDSINHLKD